MKKTITVEEARAALAELGVRTHDKESLDPVLGSWIKSACEYDSSD